MENRHRIVWVILSGLWAQAALFGQGADKSFAPRYERAFLASRAVYQPAPTNGAAALDFARACFDWADFATNNAQKIEIANQGIAAARQAVTASPQLAAPHYYLAMNLGQLADAKRSLGGLRLIAEMEREFQSARDLDANFDFAGPDRSLGLLYRDAPGWPISVGNRAKARQHLEQACALSRDYPDNRLTLLEGWLKWGDRAQVVAELKSVETVLAAARQKLAGEAWASAWADWDKRWSLIQAQAAGTLLHPPASPKHAE